MPANGHGFLTIAEDAVARGLRVVPLKGKRPFMDDWPRLASSDPETLKAWGSRYPEANCGVVTVDTWILDVDSPLWFLDVCPKVPETLTVKTGGGGLQLHFRHDGNSRAKLRNKSVPNPHKGEEGQKENLIEVLVDERQGVWAGSLHPDTGKAYEVFKDLPVGTAPPEFINWLLSLAKPGTTKLSNPLKAGWEPEERLKEAGLLFERLEKDGTIIFNYHALMGRCLVRGSSHAMPGEVPNPRQSAFVFNPQTRELWHQCFSGSCQVAGRTRLALAMLGLRLDDLLDKGMPLSEAMKAFSSRPQLDPRPLEFIVEGFMPSEALSAIAGLSGHGKTWLSLSLAKALIKGGTLWDTWKVPVPVPVLYLVPEVGDRSLKLRLDLMSPNGDGWADDSRWFLCRTFTAGQMLSLNSPEVQAVARGRVVFLDTTIRFIEGEESSSSDNNRGLAENVLGLLSQAQAKAVVLLHHSPKAFRNEQEMYLENVLRGTGDIGAMLSAAYGVRLLDPPEKGLVHVECLKPRDFEGPQPFQLQLRPSLSEVGDVQLAGRDVAPLREQRGAKPGPKPKATEDQRQLALKLATEGKSEREIADALGLGRSTVSRLKKEGLM